jgi:hypothetical protein
MNYKLASHLVVCAALFAATPAFATGQTLYNACTTPLMRFFNNASCEAMITSYVNDMMAAPHPDICLPRGFKPEQGISVVEGWMQRHPEGTMRSENNIVYNALLDSYACVLPH